MSLSDTEFTPVVLLAGLVLAVASLQPAMAQLYQPPRPYAMWDTWLFPDRGEYHLFFLQSERGVTWNKIGRAVSKDMIHWTPLASIPSKGPKGAWDEAPTLTGMTAKLGDRYVMFYGSASHGQQIGIMTSPDLKTWTKHPGNPTLKIMPPHYSGGDWRDMCTFYDPSEKRWHGYICAQTGQSRPVLGPVKDKTLVAWVYPANTRQRGGSALTLDAGPSAADNFDGIVFGERTPGKWMAGSNFYRRTPADQSAYRLETAGLDTLVQMAIVYKGDRITIYRNGEQYADYKNEDPVSFGSGTAAVFGLRHVGASERAGRFFAGAIEEARAYNVALDQAAIRGLKPGTASDQKPIALWDFKDGSTRDSMGTFPDGVLHGGATVVDGKLVLDGVDGYMITPTQGPKACIAHLVSKDLIEWDYLPPVLASPEFVDMEVPDYFELNGRHYLMFSSGRSRKDTSGRKNASGTYYVMGESRDGPYRVPGNALLLGSGNGRFDNYVGRTIPFEGGRLLYHHTAGGPVTWATPKLVRQYDDGTLWLKCWPGLAKLETRTLLDGVKGISTDDTVAEGKWSVQGDRLTGRAPKGKRSVLWLGVSAANAAITCKVDWNDAEAVGLIWRWDGKKGAGLSLRRETDIAAIVNVAAAGSKAPGLKLVDGYQGLKTHPSDKPGVNHVRVLVRAHRVEVYVNDRWIFGASLTDSPPTGRIGLLVEGGSGVFSELRIAEIEPMRIPKSAD